jgi:hypothetical protein
MSRMFYRICESMYCSIVRVRVWTALCVFKTFVLPWQRLRKKFKSMWLSQPANLISNLLKISHNSEKDTPHPSQLRPLTSSEDIKSKQNIISITERNALIWGHFEDKVTRLLRLKGTAGSKMQNLDLNFFKSFFVTIKIMFICYRCLRLNLMASSEGGAPTYPSYEGAVP